MTGKLDNQEAPVRVMISHAHDPNDKESATRAHWLFRCLRDNGVDARIDIDEVPDAGWALWMQREIEAADYVLMICTPVYRRRFDDNLESDAHGRGVRWEGRLLRTIAYGTTHPCRRLKPILFSGSNANDVPAPLRDCKCYKLPATWPLEEASRVLEELLRDLVGQRRHPLPPMGPMPVYASIPIKQPGKTTAAPNRIGESVHPIKPSPGANSSSAVAGAAPRKRKWARGVLALAMIAALVALLTIPFGLAYVIENETAAAAEALLPQVRTIIAESVVVVAPESQRELRQQLCAALKDDGLVTACMEAQGLTQLQRTHTLAAARAIAAIDENGDISVEAPTSGTDHCFQRLRLPYNATHRSCVTAVIRRIHDEGYGKHRVLTCPPAAILSCPGEMGWFLRFGASHCDGAEVTRAMVDAACKTRRSGDQRDARKCFMATSVYLDQCEQDGYCDDYEVVNRLRWETAPTCPGDEAALHVQNADDLCEEGNITEAWAAFDKAQEMLLRSPQKPNHCDAFMVAPTAICLLRHTDHVRVAKEQARLEVVGNMTISPSPLAGDGSCLEQASRALGSRGSQFMRLGRYDKAWHDFRAANKLSAHNNYTLGAAEALMLQGKDEEALRHWLTAGHSPNILRNGRKRRAALSQKAAMQSLVLLRWRASVRAGQHHEAYRLDLEAAYKKMRHGRAFYSDRSSTLTGWLCQTPGEPAARSPCPLYGLVTTPKKAGDLANFRRALNRAN